MLKSHGVIGHNVESVFSPTDKSTRIAKLFRLIASNPVSRNSRHVRQPIFSASASPCLWAKLS
jgi:hypothetical protein